MPLAQRPTLVIFDIGGVLATIDKTPIRALCRAASIDERHFFDDMFLALQTGQIKSNDFLAIKSSILGVNVEKVFLALTDMIQTGETKHLLAKLRSPYLFASNINQIHFDFFSASVSSNDFDRQSVLSYQVGYLKPQRGFFDRLAMMLTPKPAQAVFIDDKHENLAGAARLGLQPIHCPTPQLLAHILIRLNLI
jgi:FMN phosphatase YigB (HAD superfamily)